MKINCSQKSGTIQALLKTIKAKLHNTKNRYHNLWKLKCCVFLNIYISSIFLRSAGIIMYLQKYNHIQPADVADFCHGGRNS